MGIKAVAQNLENKNVNPAPEAPVADNKVEAGAGTAGAGTAGEGTGNGETGNGGTGAGQSTRNFRFAQFKAQGASIRAKKSEEEKALECSKSGAVQFVIALGNPARPSKRVEKSVQHKSYECVGYTLKALEDIKVPRVKLLAGAKTNPMAIDPEATVWEDVKAGTDFNVLLPELGLLISQPEYGGKFDGGGDEVNLMVTMSANRGYTPLSVLKRPNGVLKDQMLLIADKKDNKWVVKEGYEKFAYLFQSVAGSRHTGSGKGKEEGEAYRNLAAALNMYFQKRD